MKKRIMLVLTVLMLAAPAGATVYIDCTVDGYDVTVHFDARTEPNLVRGFALDIELNSESGATVTGFAVDSFFDVSYPIYPGSIDINDTTGEVNDFGSPICDPCEYSGTLPGLNFAGMTVEFGSLYSPPGDGSPNAPDPCGTMFTVTVSGDCIVTIVENVIRGGVVLTNPNVDAVVTSPGITIGAGGCVVPNVVDIAEAAAITAIEDAGFVAGTPTTQGHVTIVAGNVISTDPNAGAEPGCGTTVEIVVSLGCVVPDVTGMSVDDANDALVAAGFTIGTSFTNENSAQAVGTIAATYPASGATPGCGTDVNTYVSAGDCMAATHPDYTMWVGAAYGWSKPDCWCDDRQERGNADQLWQGPFPVGSFDLDLFRLALSQHFSAFVAHPEYICADFNHTWQGPFPVGSYDLNIFRKYLSDHFSQVPVTSGPGCQNVYNGWFPEGDPNHLTDPNSFRPCDANALPNSEIIFWDVLGGD